MKAKFTSPSILFILGLIALFLQFSFTSKENQNQLSQSENINLALRQTAHHLYKASGDYESQIPPVKKLSSNKYSITLDRAINYDTLPYLIDQALIDYNLSIKYNVTIKNCITNDIVLGYNIISFDNRQIPCQGRHQDSQCNIIEFTSNQPIEKSNTLGLLSVLFLVGGISSMALGKKNVNTHLEELKNKEQNVTVILPNEEKEELLIFNNSIFSPQKLTISVSGNEKDLTYRESKLLEYFYRNPNEILKREDILAHVWGEEGVIVGRSLDVFISRLRKILSEDKNISIKSVHGIGYRFEC